RLPWERRRPHPRERCWLTCWEPPAAACPASQCLPSTQPQGAGGRRPPVWFASAERRARPGDYPSDGPFEGPSPDYAACVAFWDDSVIPVVVARCRVRTSVREGGSLAMSPG